MIHKEPICKPDLDNLQKGVTDALNGIFWKDDSQITQIVARKVYDLVNPQPRIEIKIEEIAS